MSTTPRKQASTPSSSAARKGDRSTAKASAPARSSNGASGKRVVVAAPAGKASKAGKAAKTAAKASAKPSARAAAVVEIDEDDDVALAEAPPRPHKRGNGRQLVIVESPAKAKTINKYLGADFVVHASVGHVRDLPEKAPKGEKQPVPGVDLDHGFRPTYVVLAGKQKTVAELKRYAKDASEVWFATDLDREGEAIAWHLAQVLGIQPARAKRVVFNAITKTEVQKAFAHPRPIDEAKVNAQQARRILDRIVGYQASPLLWKKVARGLSAGRVQSVAVRLIVEREREIAAFVPDERWEFSALLAKAAGAGADKAIEKLGKGWTALLATRDEKGKPPTVKVRNQWLGEHGGFQAELVELGGKKFELGCPSDKPKDLSAEVKRVAEAVGLSQVEITTTEDPQGKGPARWIRSVAGKVAPGVRYKVGGIETRRTSTKPAPPFITSSLQIAAANQLGFTAQRTMRAAQALYEGVEIPGEGQVGLITYMRTDSTNLAPEAIEDARRYIGKLGAKYLPPEALRYSSSNKDAQEAHEAIRPTSVDRRPEDVASALTQDQARLYDLIWRRFVACQMVPAQWDSTAVTFVRADKNTGATLRATGRVLAFDGFYRVAGAPLASDEQTLPELAPKQEAGAFAIEAQQKFGNPPPRYTEASLVKTLESEGIGRPSTYASIISVIQERKYVEQLDRRFYATDLGEVVTDKLTEAFPTLIDVGYTRQMEAELDKIEEQAADWVKMLQNFYGPFSRQLEAAHEDMTHAKAEIQPALFKCPKCGSRTCYRFGRNGRFLSCTAYPDCDYSAPIDRDGRPQLPEMVDIACPEDGSQMELRNGRFGQFLASVNYPKITFVLNLDKKGGIKFPAPPPLVVDALQCPKCKSPMNLRRGKRGPWLGCSAFPKCRGRLAWSQVDEALGKQLEKQLEKHEKQHPPVVIKSLAGKPITEGTPVQQLLVAGRTIELDIHPAAAKELGVTVAKRAKA
ncbi:MAG: topoisomerase DNA-binding C4 zinc finger domain-containing protein [Nannocystaceae bacterium]|nr:topoisomerase DNA-binding C4 zinc finger domain-containing protein [Nannocystaceae bacterium]